VALQTERERRGGDNGVELAQGITSWFFAPRFCGAFFAFYVLVNGELSLH
jgi:hypothetical protein